MTLPDSPGAPVDPVSTSLEVLLAFWGKAQPVDGSSVAWHPVVYHLLDVAAVVEAILAVRPRECSRAAHLLGLEPEQVSRLLVLLAAFHDLGKFGRAFQGKEPALWPPPLGKFDPSRVSPTRHTDDGYVLWWCVLRERMGARVWPGAGSAVDELAAGIFGHHGRPMNPLALQNRSAGDVLGTECVSVAVACADALVDLLHPEPVRGRGATAEWGRWASWWVAGLMTVADWIGSTQKWFPYTAPRYGDTDLRGYWKLAGERAGAAVRQAGLESPPVAALRRFDQVTGLVGQPFTPTQQWAADVELPPGPVLVILEDVTGAGKTEAAQILVHRFMADGRASGAYWGMPTQATANAMYNRQAKMIGALFDPHPGLRPSLILAHGQSRLNDAYRATVFDGTRDEAGVLADAEGEADEPSSEMACAAFLADDARAALLADVGAGTIDQALLGVLPAKFNTVRLFGLAGKVLVVDEAHAYDAYMSVGLQKLLHFQATLGGSAVVLSATLSQKQRSALVKAWGDGVGAGRRLPKRPFGEQLPPLVSDQSYPLATVVGQCDPQVREIPLEAAPWSNRTVHIRALHSVSEVVEHIVIAARGGAAVAWIRNTVDDCLAAAALLRGQGLEPIPIVFHARFAQADRQAREQEVLRLFGPESTAEERRGRVLVATQVIEQSLDLDFDVLASDLAPVDLLIQRAGRLWRHPGRESRRPPGLQCELVLLTPSAVEDPGEDWLKALLPGTAAVYKNVGILWRTARELLHAGAIVTPDGVRPLVEAVYIDAPPPDGLLAVSQRAEGEERGNAAAGGHATLNVSEGYDGRHTAWVSELKALTRLGDNQIVVRLARVEADGSLHPWAEGREAAWKRWALSEVRVRASRVPENAVPDPRFTRAVAAARATWGGFEQDLPLLPLVAEVPGSWTGTLSGERNGKSLRVRYTTDSGLAFE